MACMKLGSKADSFKRQGHEWFCATGLPSDITIEVGEISFHLHKFPLLSKSGLLEKLISEKSDKGGDGRVIELHDIPAGPKSFELAAKFCYGVKFELTASNVVYLRCAAEYLQMTEEIAEGNLIAQTESFLTRVVLRDWKDAIRALLMCDDVLSYAEKLHIVKRCIDSVATKSCTDPNLFGWPVSECGGPAQSPGGSVLWNGISTGARPRNSSPDWWYEDASSLSLPLYEKLITVMESRGVKQEIIIGSLNHYAKRHLPGLNRRQSVDNASKSINSTGIRAVAPSEDEQKRLLEEMDRLLPLQKGVTPCKLLFGLLRTAIILRASPLCLSNLERRIGLQLDQATLEDLLIPNVSDSIETLYDVDCVQRILEHFIAADQQAAGGGSPGFAEEGQVLGSPSLTPITMVAKLIDGYLGEVASDPNLKLHKLQALARAIPDYARPIDDGLYRAIDIYLKAHPWLTESEREDLCRLMDCQKLSLEACTHAAQNERLPLRVIVQVLFFEQLQLRSSIAQCFLVSDDLDGSRPLTGGGGLRASGEGIHWASAVRDNQALKVGMDSMRMRVAELEKECSSMKEVIEKLGRERGGMRKKLGLGIKSQICNADKGVVSRGDDDKLAVEKVEKPRTKLTKDKKQSPVNS